MKDDEMQTNEIRPWASGFDRRDRTVRGIAYEGGIIAGQRLDVSVNGVVYQGLEGYAAGEDIGYGDRVELENGLWWRSTDRH